MICPGWSLECHETDEPVISIGLISGEVLCLCPVCAADYYGDYPEHLRDARIEDVLQAIAPLLHELAPGHDEENFRGCTHPHCVAANLALLRARRNQ